MNKHSPHGNVLDLIGNTPIVEVKNIDTGKCRLFLKMENQNPGGSIKDRIALKMIEAAENDGRLKKGGTIIEATAGNTGLGLALVASQKGYRMIIVIPDKMSQEKVFHLRAMGAEIVMTRSDVGKGHPEYYQDIAQKIANETPNSFYVNQFANTDNPKTHEEWTAPEIWQQMDGKIDAFICGVGSGGTLSGLGKYFSKVAPNLKMVLADPKGSILKDYIDTGNMPQVGSWMVEGIGEDFIPPICDLGYVDKAYTITDKESFLAARELLIKEGIMGGSSSGTLLATALKYCREQLEPKNVVTFVCDSGNKYLSKLYNDNWMFEQGFFEKEKRGNLLDLIARPFVNGATVTASKTDTLLNAYGRMRLHDISQLPVIENGNIVGIIDESDLLLAVSEDHDSFKGHVVDYMTTNLISLNINDKIDELKSVLQKGMVAIIKDGDKFMGLITRMDLLSYLRKKMG